MPKPHDELEEAIIKAGLAVDDLEEGEIVTSWICIASTTSARLDSEDTTGYLLITSGGNLPDHGVRGLMAQTTSHLDVETLLARLKDT